MDSTTVIQKRKRRTKQEIAAAAITISTDTPAPKIRSKKKQQPVVAIVTSDGIQGSFESFSKAPLIAHLDIKSADVVFYDQPFKYNPNTQDLLTEPQPYDPQNQDIFSTSAETIDMSLIGGSQVNINTSTSANQVTNEEIIVSKQETVASAPGPQLRKEYGPQELLVSFASSRQTHLIPERTDISCFWCSHPFEGRPCVIPQACEDGLWKVYGNFCCPSCCLSYLLYQTMDTHIRWERIALLNRLYASSIGGGIYPAPARETLTAFGGTFSISEYRNIIDERRIRVDINTPPMVSILASMDTKPIDFYETSIKNTFVTGGAADRFARAEEGLKLRRTKPLKDRESTLDSVLNISIKTF
jgi:hypothetical protein